jgi:anti-anti-sigma factor
MSPSSVVLRALALMRLNHFFHIALDAETLGRQLQDSPDQPSVGESLPGIPTPVLRWRGEVTAANAESVWDYTRNYIAEPVSGGEKIINLSEVRFIDSTGLGLMIRAKKMSLLREKTLVFVGLQPPVRNVLRLSRVEDFLLDGRPASRGSVLSIRP